MSHSNMKLNIRLNVSKINKDKIFEKKYKDKDGNDVVEKLYNMDVIPLKERKMISQGDGWTMYKTHFVVEKQTKEEKDAQKQSNFIGEGFEFESNRAVVDEDGRDLTPNSSNPF